MQCPRCNGIKEESEMVELHERLGGQKICENCFSSLLPLMDENHIKWEEKKLRAEQKIFKKFMKNRYSDPGNCLQTVVIIIIVLCLAIAILMRG